MPDHAHLIVGRENLSAETMAEQFKARATTFLKKAGLHPFADRAQRSGRLPTPWARHAWSVFLDSAQAIAQGVRYVEANPVKAGYKPQRYDWVKPFVA